MRNIKFRDVKGCISRIDPLSICVRNSMAYENHPNIKAVDDVYDEYYVYGIGMVEADNPNAKDKEHSKGMVLEIMLSDTPINIPNKEGEP